MSYRRGYYKKDGTYVQGHYVNSRTKYKKPKNNSSKSGCAGIIIALLLLLVIQQLFI